MPALSSSKVVLPKPKNSPRTARRTPRQERSQSTVDAILTATKALVVRHGVDKLTTNGVARLAGVSIGSLYQYFPSKRALIKELRKRHQEVGEQIFMSEAMQLVNAPVHVALQRFVEKMIEVHRHEPALHMALEQEGRGSGVGDFERRALGVIRAYMELHRHELAVTDLDQAAFIVGVTVEAITHGMVLERPHLLEDQSMVNHVVRMLLGLLVDPQKAPQQPAPSS